MYYRIGFTITGIGARGRYFTEWFDDLDDVENFLYDTWDVGRLQIDSAEIVEDPAETEIFTVPGVTENSSGGIMGILEIIRKASE